MSRRVSLGLCLLVLSALLPAPVSAAAEVEYRFTIATRGPVRSDVGSFAATVDSVLADGRGWALDGRVRFSRVASGGDFTVWLAAASSMRSFGPPCHPRYSCRSGRNVIINDDRWAEGSPPWSGPLDEYRTMVLNHETGHWLGFGHSSCPGRGRPAPVMMQQSKGTAGCVPNPWPLPSEREALARRLRLPPPSRTVGLAGRWTVSADGRVTPAGLGDAPGGSAVGIAATPSEEGYWLVAGDGGVFSFGDARFRGSMGDGRVDHPVVGMAAIPSGGGYWLVAGDGGVFSFGCARFRGSMGGTPLASPVVGMAATPSGGGYWLVAGDGGVFSFGDARFHGRPEAPAAPVVGMAATPSGRGYWLVAGDGEVFAFGDADLHGTGRPGTAAIAATRDGGYRLAHSDGTVTSHGG